MVNRHRSEATVVVAGKTYVMRATIGALAEIEDALGLDSLNDLDVRMQRIKARDIIAILRALISAGGQQVEDSALESLTMDELEPAIEGISAAMATDAGEPEKNAKAVARRSRGRS